MSASVKIVVVGSQNAGKSCLIHKFHTNEFLPQTQRTVGPLYMRHDHVSPVYGPVRVDIWDTAGHERQRIAVPPHFFRDADGVLVVVEQSEDASLDAAEQFWLPCVLNQAMLSSSFVFFCLSKVDLRRRNSDMEARTADLVKRLDVRYWETSALTGESVREVFEALIEHILADRGSARKGHVGGAVRREPVPLPPDLPAAPPQKHDACSRESVEVGEHHPFTSAAGEDDVRGGGGGCMPVKCIVA